MEQANDIDTLVDLIRLKHEWKPALTESSELIHRFEAASGYVLPDDVRQFYCVCGSATLFGSYVIPEIREWKTASLALRGEPDWCPASWFACCDVANGDQVAIELDERSANRFAILDCDQEDMSRVRVIALSFSEFLSRVLKEEDPYWLRSSFRPYATLRSEGSSALFRRIDAAFWQRLGAENGPRQCGTAGCSRLTVAFSSKCRRHHYEMTKKRPCPYEFK